ncbi:MAG: hypothetical protein NC416_03025 [Eubacterium sp.]|nr:hypothetical protein [Eubacterium sp.]
MKRKTMKRRMRRKNLITTCIMTLILAAAAGCAGQNAESENTVPAMEGIPTEDAASPAQNNDTQTGSNTAGTPTSSNEDASLNNEANPAQSSQESDFPSNTPDTLFADAPKDSIFIGGKVRSIAEDSFVISRTLVEDSMVTIPEEGSPEEELVTILCTDSTTFEHWTIQGSGADIVTDEASFSEIQKGDGLEAKGHFDGEVFIADKVIIEVYE